MRKKLLNLLGLVILLLQFISPIKISAETASQTAVPSGTKTIKPVGIDTSSAEWTDGIALGGTYLTYDSAGIIKGFATDQTTGAVWDTQKLKNVTDNEIAYCLNFNLPSSNGDTSTQLSDLTPTQQKELSNLLKLGYVEEGTKVYKGPGVSTLSNIDAYTATQWMVHEIVPTYDMSKFAITNPTLQDAVNNLSSWIHNDLGLSLSVTNDLTDDGTNYNESYELGPVGIPGSAKITLDTNIAGASLTVGGVTSPISATQPVTVNTGDKFTISIPNTTATNTINVLANGGTASYSFAEYQAPVAGQQNVLVVGPQYTSTESTNAPMSWTTVAPVIPSIGTTATNKADGSHSLPANSKVVVNDEVAYENLTVGQSYTLSGVLMDKTTGKAVMVDGKEVTGSTDFTPTTASGTANVEFSFDTTGLSSHDLVVYESLSQAGKVVAEHKDINAESQTVGVQTPPTIPATPKIGTTATNKADGSHSLPANSKVVVNDEVAYENLTLGQSYTLSGVLMDKTTGKAVMVDGKEVTGSTDFTPTTASGTANVEFSFDTTGLSSHDLVVYESLSQAGKVVAEHKDINAESQTVGVQTPPTIPATPKIGTTATNKADGSHSLPANSKVVVNDEVAYENLTVGQSYTLSGVLMDKTTGKAVMVDGKEVTGSTDFTSTTASGTANVEFSFDTTGLSSHDLVVYESLSQAGKVVAEHKDINAESQTVTVKKPNEPLATVNENSPAKTVLPQTGDAVFSSILVTSSGVLLVLLGYLIWKRKDA